MVRTHAQSKLTVMHHLTAETLFVKPTPIIEPVIVWVVETGIPKCSVRKSVIAPAVSALTPSSGVTLVILVPVSYTHLDVYKRQALMKTALLKSSLICLSLGV